MPFALLFIGLILIMTAYAGTTGNFLAQFESDMLGTTSAPDKNGNTTRTGGFLVWIALIVIISVGGKALGLETAAKGLLILLIGVFILENPTAVQAVSTQITSANQGTSNAIAQGQPTLVTPTGSGTTTTAPSSNNAGAGGANPGQAASAAGIMQSIPTGSFLPGGAGALLSGSLI